MGTPSAAKLLLWPGVGEWTMTVFGDRTLATHNKKYYFAPDKYPDQHAKFAEQLEYKGYKSAILSTMRNMPMTDFTEGYRALGALGKPVMLVWGTQDRTFPFSSFERAKALLPGCEPWAIESAAHLPQVEQPSVVGPALAVFLSKG
jgi:pimeloyl-ACP methyl ester carboxylesterase